MIRNCCYISRGLFRLVGVRSVCWVVRDVIVINNNFSQALALSPLKMTHAG
jgi:hypothetical protein